MGRELLIVWAGRHKKSTWEELCSGYRRRISRQVPVRDVPVRVGGAGDAKSRRRAEGEALIAALPQSVWSVALERQGEMLSSEDLARKLATLRREWPHTVAFLLGSDLGLDPEVLARSRQILSLGRLTLPHELARLVLYEQLYRALAIEAGINYHRQPL